MNNKKIFDYDDYRAYVRAHLRAMPRAGRGQFRQIALHLGMHTTAVSQVFKGTRGLTPEQGLDLAEYLGLGQLETECLMLLVRLDRAGTQRMRRHLQSQLEKMRDQAGDLVNRLPRDQVMNEECKAVFYSSWFYSGVRMVTSISGNDVPGAIAERLHLPIQTVTRVLEFLVANGLCVEDNGKYRVGSQRTHLEASSPLIPRHHINWRLKAMERFDRLSTKDDLVFTAPMTLAKKDVRLVRGLLMETVERVREIAVASESEVIQCFNLDWVEVI